MVDTDHEVGETEMAKNSAKAFMTKNALTVSASKEAKPARRKKAATRKMTNSFTKGAGGK